MKAGQLIILAVLMYLSLLLGQSALAIECHVDKSKERNVTFISDATFEDFEGVTEKIDGYAFWSGDSLRTGVDFPESQIYFEVQLDALDTGIGMRNSDMREDYLETDEHPYAKYKAQIVEVVAKEDGSYIVTSKGQMTIHGVSNAMTIDAAVTPEQHGYHVTSQFSVMLPDFKIDIPKFLFMRVNEKIELELDYHLKVVVNGSEEGE